MARNANIVLRRGTASEWTTANPTLNAGEAGFETDTGKLKIGNGTTAWVSLSYVTDPTKVTGTALTRTSTSVVSIKDYGAVGDGVTDDSAAIQSALDACPAGGVVIVPAQTFAVASPIVIPPTITLNGTHGNRIFYDSSPVGTPQPSMIKAKSTFSGTAIIVMKDKTDGGYSYESTGQRITNLTIDGSALSGGSVRGIYATGRVREVLIHRVAVQFVPGNGFANGLANGNYPYSWYITESIARSCGNYGFSFTSFTDSTFINCQSLYSGVHGWNLSACANSHFTNCRSEWSGQHGFNITGGWGTSPAGSGGAVFTACSTDRNNYNGFSVVSTGNGPLTFNGLMLRRDGRNGNSGGGSYAGFNADSATSPILINTLSVYPGNNDDATGTVSPFYGVSFSSNSYVAVDGTCFIHGFNTGWYDNGSNTVLLRGNSVSTRTGSPSSPSSVALYVSPIDGGSA